MSRPYIDLDSYLTDGTRLFRIAAVLGSHVSALVVLEDCHSLELTTFKAQELATGQVRLVRGSAPEPEVEELEIVANFR
jgi:hypothetical protein